MRIGFVVAMEAEYEPFLNKLGELGSEECVCGVGFCAYGTEDRRIILAKSGIGEIAASTATALLIGHFCCDYVVNYGLVGSLDGGAERSVVAIRDVVHYDADITAFGHPLGAPADLSSPYLAADPRMLSRLEALGLPALRLASGDKFIANEELKNRVRSDFFANVCDMEGAGVALTCVRSGVPFTMIKLISDGAGEGAVESYSANKCRAFDFAISVVLSAIEGV